MKILDKESLSRTKGTQKTEPSEGDGKIEDGKVLDKMTADCTKFQQYSLDKLEFGMKKAIFSFTQESFFLLSGIYPFLWDQSISFATSKFGESEIYASIVFISFVYVIDTIIGLPWSIYFSFVLEQKHGFNKMTPQLFVTDLLTSTCLAALLGTPVLVILIKIIKWGGEYFYLFVFAFLFVFSIFFLTIFPVFIQPLFNKYEPLPEGELKDTIFALAARLKFPLTKLYVVDGSKRSSHSNAYLYGFFNNKRIVLFDTLIKQMNVPELEAVLGHEIGHWALGHVLQMFVIQQLYFLAMFMCFGRAMNDPQIYSAFGFDASVKPTLIGLILFMTSLWAPGKLLFYFRKKSPCIFLKLLSLPNFYNNNSRQASIISYYLKYEEE